MRLLRSGLGGEFDHLWSAELVSATGSQVTYLAVPLTAALLVGAPDDGDARRGALRWDASTRCLMQEGDWHAVWVAWLDTGEHRGWYVNLQEPFRRTPPGFQTMDLMLDVVVDRDGRWRWKEEGELRFLVDLKVLGRSLARRVRAEARRVVGRLRRGEAPFGEPWPDWRPDPSWRSQRCPTGGIRCRPADRRSTRPT